MIILFHERGFFQKLLATALEYQFLVRVVSFSLFIGSFLPACSLILGREPTKEEKAAVLRITGDYLQHIVSGNEQQLLGMILWTDYSAAKQGMTKERFHRELSSLKNRWSPEVHPLINLDLVSLDIYKDTAEVRLKRSQQPDAPEIWVKLLWIGQGWLVQNDSLFGPDGLIEKHP